MRAGKKKTGSTTLGQRSGDGQWLCLYQRWVRGTARGEVLHSATWVSARVLVQGSLYLLVCLFVFLSPYDYLFQF